MWNAGTGVLHYTATATDVWITSIAPTNGVSSAGAATAPRVVLDPAPLAPGMHPARLWLNAPAATNAPQFVQVFLDIVAVYQNVIAWWRNTGNVSFVKIIVVSNVPGACAIDAADFDRDGDTDFIGSSLDDNEIAWFENTGSYSNFIRHQIVWSVDRYAITAAAVDNNGIMDFFAGDNPCLNDFFWCQNDGLQNFTRRNIDTSHDLATICVVDLDGNGWLDARGGAGTLLSWYQSGGTAVLALARAPHVLAQEVLLGANATTPLFHVWNSGPFGLPGYAVAEPAGWITARTPAGGTCTNDVPHEHRVTFSTAAKIWPCITTTPMPVR